MGRGPFPRPAAKQVVADMTTSVPALSLDTDVVTIENS